MEENRIEIVTSKIDFNAKCTFTGYTPLHYACQEGNVQAVACMLEHFREIDWNAKDDSFKETPLHVACRKGNIEIIKLMAERSKIIGINLTVKDKYGDIPLVNSLSRSNYEEVKQIFYANIPTQKLILMNFDKVILFILMLLSFIGLILVFRRIAM